MHEISAAHQFLTIASQLFVRASISESTSYK